MTEADHEAIATLVAQKIENQNLCNSFSKAERETLHTIHRARSEAKDVGHTELLALFQLGKSLGTGFKRGIFSMGLLAFILIAILSLKAVGFWALLIKGGMLVK